MLATRGWKLLNYTLEHASLREFTVKKADGTEKRIVMCVWGLTGSGKSTHGMYIFDKRNARIYMEKFGIAPAEYVSDQVVRNDDIVAIFEDRVEGSEKGSWTKTEGVDETQGAIWDAGMSPRALHENTEFGPDGNPSFKGELFQFYGAPNRNARTVFYLADTGYFDGNVVSSGPLNMAILISLGYFTDYAWLKIEDPALAAKILADGRTIGHPAQAKAVIGQVRYVTRYCLPFTMGTSNTAHVVRFHEFLKKRKESGNPIEAYKFNTTGRIAAKYEWVKQKLGDKTVELPNPKLVKVDDIPRATGGTRPTIEETELFILQAARDMVKYEPHPIWGEKALVPVKVEGIPKERLRELYLTFHLPTDEIKRLLKAQILASKYYLGQQCPGLPDNIRNAMDF